VNYGIVENCIVEGLINTTPFSNNPALRNVGGGIVGDNKGTVSNCSFSGSLIGPTVGGIVGSNCGTVTNSHVTASISSGTIEEVFLGGVIGYVYSSNGIDFISVDISGNSFSKSATGQTWGIGEDRRLSTPAPSNDGITDLP